MPIRRKPLEIPPEVARKFVAYMQDYFAEHDPIRKDGIAADARHLLLEHMPERSRLRVSEIRDLFEQMKSLS